MKKKNNYINNKELLEEIRKSRQHGRLTEKAGLAFMQIATRYASKPNFANYSYKDEMICDAICKMCEVWEKFDETKSSNIFAYMTSVTHNQFVQILNKEKNQRNIRDAILEDSGLDPSYTYQDDTSGKDKKTTSGVVGDEPYGEIRFD